MKKYIYQIIMYFYNCYMFIVRLFTISRDNAFVFSMSHLFISLSIGALLILHTIYYKPLLNHPNTFSLYSILYSLLAHAMIKTLVFWILRCSIEEHLFRQKWLSRKIGFIKLIYTSIIKWWTYLNFILLLIVVKYLSFSIAIIASFLFLLFLQFGTINNRITRVMNKGRSFGISNFKMMIILTLVIISIALQPIKYEFSNQLHFQIFIIFTFSLLVFSYSYLHKLAFAITIRQTVLSFIFEESCIQLLCVIFFIGYNLVMWEKGLGLSEQLSYIGQKWYIFMAIVVLSLLNEIVLAEFLKKISYCRGLITKATGFVWFNIYLMAKSQINVLQYVSVILMMIVLLISIELMSQEKIKAMMQWLFRPKSKRQQILHEESQINDGTIRQ